MSVPNLRPIAENVQANDDQRLYVISNGHGYSCLGFEVERQRTSALAAELAQRGIQTVPVMAEPGSPDAWDERGLVLTAALNHYADTKRRFECELTPQLVGLEGNRVEIVDRHGAKRRFWVGRSTGWLPIHLEIHNSRSMGGGAATGAPYQSIRVIRDRR